MPKGGDLSGPKGRFGGKKSVLREDCVAQSRDERTEHTVGTWEDYSGVHLVHLTSYQPITLNSPKRMADCSDSKEKQSK